MGSWSNAQLIGRLENDLGLALVEPDLSGYLDLFALVGGQVAKLRGGG